MLKKMLGTFTGVVAALAVVGVAWAGTDDNGPTTSVTTADFDQQFDRWLIDQCHRRVLYP